MPIKFLNNVAVDTSVLFVDTVNDRVGIGTTSPNRTFTVASNDFAIAEFSRNTAGGGAAIVLQDGNDGEYELINGVSNFQIRSNFTDTQFYITRSTGNVGIGTTSPSQKLHVVGDALLSGYMYSSNTSVGFGQYFTYFDAICAGGMFVRNTSGTHKPVYASAFYVVSDYRLKNNIEPLENAIDRLNQLEVYRFNWNDRLNEPKVDGFIAHEVAPIIPEAVFGEKDELHEDGMPKHQGVDQAKIVPLLTAALQEAIAKIESLEYRIQTLENQ